MSEYDLIVAACTRPDVMANVRGIVKAAPAIADTLAGWDFSRNIVEVAITDALDEASANHDEVSWTPSSHEIGIVTDSILAAVGGAA